MNEADDVVGEASDKLRMLFPTVVQVSDIEGAPALNQKLLDAIHAIRASEPSTKPDSWSCDLYTTIGSATLLLERDEFREFNEVAMRKVLRYAEAFKFDTARYRPKINECWVNVYSRTHAQEIHIHQNSVFSGIYYVKAPPGCAPTLFHSPMGDVMLEPPTTGKNPLNSTVAGFDAVEGRMLVFRSSLRHSVLPSTIDEERVTIAFNVTM